MKLLALLLLLSLNALAQDFSIVSQEVCTSEAVKSIIGSAGSCRLSPAFSESPTLKGECRGKIPDSAFCRAIYTIGSPKSLVSIKCDHPMEFFDTDVKNVDSFEVNALLTDSQGTQHLYESGKSYHNASSSFINVTLVRENGLVKGQIQFGFGKFKKNLENVICN